ncbi:MAG: ferritin family protein [Thermoanaerobaculia bacterium]
MLISHAFRPMIDLEKELSALYGSWADRFSSDTEASQLFARMSREESGHASLIEYQQRIHQKNRQFEKEVQIEPSAIEATIAEIRTLRTSAPPSSVAHAVTLALGMETSAAETHFKNALRQANEEVAKLLNTLGKEDGAHLAALKEFATKRGIPLPE